METMAVAKKKPPRGKPASPKASTIAVTLRGSPEWKAWVEALARHARLDVTGNAARERGIAIDGDHQVVPAVDVAQIKIHGIAVAAAHRLPDDVA